MIVLFYLFLFLNVISFLLIGYDKYLAKKNKKRISEKTLLTLVFIGGTLGSGLGMLFFRHKTSKKEYLIKFWTTLVLQLFIAIVCLYFYI